MRRKGKVLLFMLVAVMLVIAGCSKGGSGSGGDARNIVIGVVTEPDTIDIHGTSSVGDANGAPYDSLMEYDFDGNLIPNLIEEYEVADDGLSVTFHMRDDAKFHSGEPVTAEAIKQTFERLMDRSPFSTNVGTVENIEVIDDTSFTIEWSEPFAPIFSNLTSQYLAPIDVSVLDEDGDGFEKNPIASGPLMVDEIKRGDSIIYKPFDEYYNWENDEPGFDEVKFRFITDDETRVLEFKRGNVNVLLDVPFQYVEELEEDEEVDIIRVPNYVMNYLGWNNKLPIFQDEKVRQAIALAIDRDAIIQTTFNGEATPIFGPLPPATYGYSEDIENMAKEKYTQDIEQAKQLLSEAGWEAGSGGVVEKDGEKFSVELWVDNDPANQRAAQIIQNQLMEIGIEINISVMESAAIIEMTPQGQHEMLLWSFGWLDADVLNFLLFGDGKSTRLHYEKEEIYSILEEAGMEMDTEKRLAMYEEAQKLLIEQSPWVPLYVKDGINAVRGFDKFEIHPIGNNIVWETIQMSE
ncbi:ABC transporter substrate-binding protein [Ornithinibacillus sp. 4-3]|uniref:ABC transporter substrate-binding protein n=1 Tax=Ornithinibacillus sp. 4-3 TaxID=3231488 RepID=A0AB39HNZ0_9BACI